MKVPSKMRILYFVNIDYYISTRKRTEKNNNNKRFLVNEKKKPDDYHKN